MKKIGPGLKKEIWSLVCERDSQADSRYKKIEEWRKEFLRSVVLDWELDPLQYSIRDMKIE